MLNSFLLNPAMAGYDGYTSVNTTARNQWVGFGDTPQTISASWQTRLLAKSYRIVGHPVRNKNILIPSTKGRVGLGAYLINDGSSVVNRTGAQFSYAYHILLNNHQLSFGIAAKAFQYRINLEDLDFGRIPDPIQTSHTISGVGYIPDVDLGIYFTNMVYFVGLSSGNVMQSALNMGGSEGYRIKRHYWLMGGYKFDAMRNLAIEPTALIKTNQNWIWQADFGAKFYYNEDFWLGLSGRTDGTLITILGFRKDGLFMGYAFDLSFSEMQRFNYGTHEITISYKFGDNARRYRWLRRY